MKKFPENFYWGASTASYQVEGWNENTDWAVAGKQGKVPLAGRLADHYHLYEEDFDIAKELGHNAHRFSIEWARIEPSEGVFDETEIEHYRDVLKALKKRGITPFITLWHFTLPLWLSESGGFERKDSPQVFANYCKHVVERLGDLCEHFATINEPNVYATHGYLYGAWPPFQRASVFGKKMGKEDGTSERTGAKASFKHLFVYMKVVRNLSRAHCAAYDVIKKVNPDIKVSIVKHVRYFYSNWNPLNIVKAKIATYFQTGQLMKRVSNHVDEIGLNFYRSTGFGTNETFTYTDMGWKVVPHHIYYALYVLKKYKKPIFIAEAGVADREDAIRAQYIQSQIEGVAKALEEGIDVRGHLYWSLMDNYEWALGTEKCFGLVEIDYRTLERKIRPSAWDYKKLIEKYTK